MTPTDLHALRQQLMDQFSPEAILALAQDYFPDVYKNLNSGMEKGQMVRLLLEHAQNNGQLSSLQQRLQNRLPATQHSQSPTFYANQSYGLEQGFTGRARELALLNEWFTQDTAHPLFALIALGGTGKSALTWHWLTPLRTEHCPLSTILWWDFYQNSSIAEFLHDALSFLGYDPAKVGHPRLQANQLLNHLRRQPALLVLDGAERLLRIMYQGDEETAAEDSLHARDCTDPVAADLLVALSQLPGGSKTVLTSRLMPRALEGRGGMGLAGVRRHDLTGLDLEDACRLFNSLGIKATRAEVQAACEPLAYHPLSLRLLAGYAAHDPQTPNDLKAATGYDPTADLLGRRQHVLQQAYDSLPPQAQQLLSKLAAFRSSVAWAVVEQVMGGGQVRRDLELLERRGLVQRTVRQVGGTSETSYDPHPIVRRYAYDRLVDRAGIHTQLVTYFAAVPQPTKIQHPTDLTSTIELYYQLVKSQEYTKASEIYHHRLSQPLYYQFADYQQIIELLTLLFSSTQHKQVSNFDPYWKGQSLNSLGNSHSMLGQLKEAGACFEQAIVINKLSNNKVDLAIALANIASMALIPSGKLQLANKNILRSIELCQEIKRPPDEATAQVEYGLLLIYLGKLTEAEFQLTTAIQQLTLENDLWYLGIAWSYVAIAHLMQKNGEKGLTAAKTTLSFAEKTLHRGSLYEANFIWAYWLVGWAYLVLQKFDLAQENLAQALYRCRVTNNINSEPAILLAQARLARATAPDSTLPHTHASEARLIAERAGYVLDLADIHNFLAHLALDAGDHTTARTHAQQARTYAWCDGPPYAYQPALDEAERLLANY